MKLKFYILSVLLVICTVYVKAQNSKTDSVTTANVKVMADTISKAASSFVRDTVPAHDPRKATFRSAVLPGWGQAYNKEYWKIPVVYGVLGVLAGVYIYNDKWYKKSKFAFETRINLDTANYSNIDEQLSYFSIETLRYYRNDFRKNRDYSILYFLLGWGLNVVDATVFGHLKNFDVSPDLSLKVKPSFNPIGKSTGLSLVLETKSSTKNRVLQSR